jgi:hypothetical protein
VLALPVLEPLSTGNLAEPSPRRRHALRRPRNDLPLQRHARMQLERKVLDLEVVLRPEPVDPSLADVAPRSNKVADNEQLQRHSHSVPLLLLITPAGPGAASR